MELVGPSYCRRRSRVPSVEPPSTMMCSSRGYDWPMTDLIVCSRRPAGLRDGVTIETSGRPFITGGGVSRGMSRPFSPRSRRVRRRSCGGRAAATWAASRRGHTIAARAVPDLMCQRLERHNPPTWTSDRPGRPRGRLPSSPFALTPSRGHFLHRGGRRHSIGLGIQAWLTASELPLPADSAWRPKCLSSGSFTRYPSCMTRERLRAAVVGAGYVGLATAVRLAEQGHQVVLVERDPGRLATLTDGRIPFHEPGLPEAYATQHAARSILLRPDVPQSAVDLILVCVGTPVDDTGSSDLSHVEQALVQAAPGAAAGALCVIRSTLPVGSATRLASQSGIASRLLFVAPEFLRQGSALDDIRRPTRVVIGTFGDDPDPDALAARHAHPGRPGRAAPRYAGRGGESREERLERVPRAAPCLRERGRGTRGRSGRGRGPGARGDRIGPQDRPRVHAAQLWLRGKLPAEGGPLALQRRPGPRAPDASGYRNLQANADHQRRFARRIADAVGGLAGKRIALLGLAFKADTDDVRSSPALRLAARLLDGGADLRAHDPAAGDNARTNPPAIWRSCRRPRRHSKARTPR